LIPGIVSAEHKKIIIKSMNDISLKSFNFLYFLDLGHISKLLSYQESEERKNLLLDLIGSTEQLEVLLKESLKKHQAIKMSCRNTVEYLFRTMTEYLISQLNRENIDHANQSKYTFWLELIDRLSQDSSFCIIKGMLQDIFHFLSIDNFPPLKQLSKVLLSRNIKECFKKAESESLKKIGFLKLEYYEEFVEEVFGYLLILKTVRMYISLDSALLGEVTETVFNVLGNIVLDRQQEKAFSAKLIYNLLLENFDINSVIEAKKGIFLLDTSIENSQKAVECNKEILKKYLSVLCEKIEINN